MKPLALIVIAMVCALVAGCGTAPEIKPGDVRLEIDDNRPSIYIVPPEDPVGTAKSVITDYNESSGGLCRSFNERIEFDNITVYREVKNITYYSYWYYGLVKSMEEERCWEPAGVRKDIEISGCIYDGTRKLINYEAVVNGVPYYYAGVFNSDTVDYGQFPTN